MVDLNKNSNNDGIIYGNMDESISPHDDFFKYVNGTWIKNAKIPDDKGAWGSFYELSEKTDSQLKVIFESLKNDTFKVDSDEWKAMKYYQMAMDTDSIEKSGMSVCGKFLSIIDECDNFDELFILAINKIPMKSIFHIYPSADPENSDMMITGIWQSGMSLPEKSFYFDEDDKSKDIRKKYIKFLSEIYQNLGLNNDESKSAAEFKMQVETQIAKISKNKVETRDPIANTNKKSFSELCELTDKINWKLIFSELNINIDVSIDVGQPEFIKNLGLIIKKYTLDEWKLLYKSNLILSYSPYLNSAIEKLVFGFYSKTLNGVKEMEPRWKRKQRLVCSDLRDAIGKIYVQKYFPKDAKDKMLKLVNNLRSAFEIRLKNNYWMSDETKIKAINKLNAMNFKIGYPDRWNDYSKLKILDSFLETGIEMNVFDTKYGEQGLDKIGKPKDKTVWHMGPYVVNAYYNPTVNENVFPAGILQAPFFDINADDSINYGAIGAVISHEMTHGFDDSGKHFNESGNLEEWWTSDDSKRFEALTTKVIAQYNSYLALPDLNLNGELVLGEAIADLGGLSIAFDGYMMSLKEKGIEIDSLPSVDSKFTYRQKFFIGFTQVWNGIRRDESLRTLVKTDPHPPGNFRVLGTLSNMESFYSAFDVKKNDGMFLDKNKRCNIW